MTATRKVFKYPLSLNGLVSMHEGAEVLSVAEQGGSLMLWALVDPEAPVDTRRFWVAGTGWPIDPDGLGRFIGTVQVEAGIGALVWHVWEARS